MSHAGVVIKQTRLWGSGVEGVEPDDTGYCQYQAGGPCNRLQPPLVERFLADKPEGVEGCKRVGDLIEPRMQRRGWIERPYCRRQGPERPDTKRYHQWQ